MKRQRSSSFVVDEASCESSEVDTSEETTTSSSDEDTDNGSNADAESAASSASESAQQPQRPSPAKCTWVHLSSCTICPPSLLNHQDTCRTLSFTCCSLNPVSQNHCVVAFSSAGPITFPLFPLATPQEYCRWRLVDEFACRGVYGVLAFRRATPPVAPSPAGDGTKRPLLAMKLPQVLTTSLGGSAWCGEVAMTERMFDVAWLGSRSFVGSVPCEERLVVVQYASLDATESTTPNPAPMVHYQQMPRTVVPLAVCCIDVRCGPIGGDKTEHRDGSGCTAKAHRVVVTTLHDGVFTFSVSMAPQDARGGDMHCSMHAVHHITPSFGRSVFAPAVRIVPFAIGSNGLGVPLRSVVPPVWEEVCVACMGPYDSRMFIWHMASSRRIDVECVKELSPLAFTSVGESVLAVETLGAVDHVALVGAPGMAARRQSQFGVGGHRNHPVAVSAAVARRDRTGLIRRDIVCVLSAEGTLGLIHRVSRTMGGFRYLGDASPPHKDLEHGVFCCLAHNGAGPVDGARDHCGQTLDVMVLSLSGTWTTYQCRFASKEIIDDT